MKNILTVLLVALMLCPLISCGTLSTAPAETETPASGTSASSYSGESGTYIIHTTANEGTTTAKALDYFCDEVEKSTGGKVAFMRYYAGTLCSQTETLDFLSSGSIAFALLGTNLYSSVLPLMGFPGTIFAASGTGGSQYAVDYGNDIIMNDQETSPLIQGEAEKAGIHYLGVTASGTNVFVSKKPLASLADLSGLRLGTAANYNAFESLGCTVIETMPGDVYDSFQRGIIDCSEMSLSSAVRLMWYEVANHYALDGTFGWGSVITVNSAVWNGASPELQAILTKAAADTGAYTAALDDESIEDCRATLSDHGVELGSLPDEDCQKWGAALFQQAISDARTLAQGKDYADNLETILAAACRYLKVDLPAR